MIPIKPEDLPLGYAIHKIVCDPQGRPIDYIIEEINERFEQMTGLHESDVVGKKITELIPEIMKQQFNWIAEYGDIALSGQSKQFIQYFAPFKKWFKINAFCPQRGFIVTLIDDITQMKQYEEDLARLNSKLTDANKDLEMFIHAVAHDLDSPLRRVEMFSDIILQEKANDLEPSVKDYFTRIQNGIKLARDILTGLFTLSNLYDLPLNWQPVPLGNVINEIIAEFKEQTPDRKVAVSINSMIVVRADPIMMRILFKNLISNSWKYSEKDKTLQIKFDYVPEKPNIIYFEDNGIGVPEKELGRVFNLFQRFHKKTHEVKGTGVGLALVKKIIDRHEWRIWLSSTENVGTTFYIEYKPV
jgi:signal transduction histidine kinase